MRSLTTNKIFPVCFRVTIGVEDVILNQRILLFTMVLYFDPVLHIFNDRAKFSSPHLLADVSIDKICKTRIAFRACIYTGIPNRILTDQGTQFGENFINLARLADVEVNLTGIGAHSS